MQFFRRTILAVFEINNTDTPFDKLTDIYASANIVAVTSMFPDPKLTREQDLKRHGLYAAACEARSIQFRWNCIRKQTQ